MRHSFLHSLLLTVLISVFSVNCASKKRVDGDLSLPGPYFVHLYNYLESGSGDPKEWCEEVTEAYCSKGEDFLKNHFTIWKNALVPSIKERFGGDASKVPVELNDGTLSIMIEPGKPENISVLLERGRLRINEL